MLGYASQCFVYMPREEIAVSWTPLHPYASKCSNRKTPKNAMLVTPLLHILHIPTSSEVV